MLLMELAKQGYLWHIKMKPKTVTVATIPEYIIMLIVKTYLFGIMMKIIMGKMFSY